MSWVEDELQRLLGKNNICDKCGQPASEITSVVVVAKTHTRVSGGLYNHNLCEKCFRLFENNLDNWDSEEDNSKMKQKWFDNEIYIVEERAKQKVEELKEEKRKLKPLRCKLRRRGGMS